MGDTSPEVRRLVLARLRAMSPAERFEQVVALNDACDTLAEAGVRHRWPDASSSEVRRAVIERRIGVALAREAYGDPTPA